METKICTKCGKEKPLSEFSKNARKRDGYQCACKECMAEYNRIHYLKNKEIYNIKAANQSKECVEYMRSIKEQLKCSKCGENRWWMLDFHHINPKEKENTVANLAHSGSIQKVKNEIEKCIVLCANCHRDEHYQQKLKSKQD